MTGRAGRLLSGTYQPWVYRYQRHWGVNGAVAPGGGIFFSVDGWVHCRIQDGAMPRQK